MKKITIVAHSGKFHADDVFAVATLFIVIAKEGYVPHVIRSRDPKEWAAAQYVVDVGGEYVPEENKFDHHQEGGAGKRENGLPYAAFGLVWKKFGPMLCGEAAALSLDRKMVAPLDAADSGVEIVSLLYPGVFPYSVGQVVSSFLPTWKDAPEDYDVRFMDAVLLARTILAREINTALTDEEAKTRVKELSTRREDPRVIVLDAHYSETAWGSVAEQIKEVLYVIYPSNNSWHATAVRKDPTRFDTRKPFPVTWRGKRDEEFVQLTGVADARFCHNAGFLAVAGTKEGAIKLANLALAA